MSQEPKFCLICNTPLNPDAGWATCLAHRNSTDFAPSPSRSHPVEGEKRLLQLRDIQWGQAVLSVLDAKKAERVFAKFNSMAAPRVEEESPQAAPVPQDIVEAIRFYADPGTYHGVMFMFDPPGGGFREDFSSDHGDSHYDREMPGKLAREMLAKYDQPEFHESKGAAPSEDPDEISRRNIEVSRARAHQEAYKLGERGAAPEVPARDDQLSLDGIRFWIEDEGIRIKDGNGIRHLNHSEGEQLARWFYAWYLAKRPYPAPSPVAPTAPRPMNLKVHTERAQWTSGKEGKWLQVQFHAGGFAQSMPAALADEIAYRINHFEPVLRGEALREPSTSSSGGPVTPGDAA